MAIQAVITGDIVNSTRLAAAEEKKLLKILQQLLAPYQFEFYRGDSLQVYQKQATEALKTALLCRTAAISISQKEETPISDVRIAIGIGQVKTTVKTLGAAKDEAFVLSGRAFDEMAKTGMRLSITTGNSLANEGLQVIADYINTIFKVMTARQATVIFELLKGQTQQKVAAKLKKSKSTINQHVSSGRWAEIEKLLQHYENIINQLT
ncbi:MAG: hypothetical protein H7Z13_03600 [Ferruginibacter sp.]|nr:hypothetical protein [Ferruginibacter sp.]